MRDIFVCRSAEVFAVLRQFACDDMIGGSILLEKASIDEAYLDLTAAVRQRIEQQLGSYASRSFFFGAFSYNGEFAARYAAGGPFLFRFAYLRSSCIPVRVRPAVL